MESISPVTVFLLLQYIKDISVPIPSDLLSVPLRQRHHFLNLSFTADPASFLCWPNPSTNAAQTIHSLQSIELDTESPAFDYRYVADSEHIYAHVSVASGAARLVFMWDPSDVQWKYHDAASMPFPSTCYESVHDALAHASSDPIDSSFVPPMSGVEENDDSYWNMYGQEDSDLENNNRRQPSGSNEVSEDAYWAQYSEVQGMYASPRMKSQLTRSSLQAQLTQPFHRLLLFLLPSAVWVLNRQRPLPPTVKATTRLCSSRPAWRMSPAITASLRSLMTFLP